AECLRHQTDRFHIQGEATKQSIEREVSVGWSSGAKELRVHAKITDLAGYLGNLDALVVSFDQLPIVRGAPAERRKFLDRGIAQLKKSYLHLLAQFHHALRQRNNALQRIREGAATIAELTAWDRIFADLALAVTRERALHVEQLNMHLPAVQFS